MAFGTLRYGNLLETELDDCRRYLDYKDDHAKALPQWVEDWLIARIRGKTARISNQRVDAMVICLMFF